VRHIRRGHERKQLAKKQPISKGMLHSPYKLQIQVADKGLILLSENKSSAVERFRDRLEKATSYGEVWEIVKDNVEFAVQRRRSGMMLFLDDLPIQLGAYHPVGTNNIVLNRLLVQVVEAAIESRRVVNALIYNLLLHEYLHALGEYSEMDVRRLVYNVAKKCFGEEHIATLVAKKSPWSLLKGIPLGAVNAPKRVIEIVKDFEKADRYIV
jgi:hypothetical protein